MAVASFIDAGGAAEAKEVALGDLARSLGFMLKMGHLRARALHEAALRAASLSPAHHAILSCIGLNPSLRERLLAAAPDEADADDQGDLRPREARPRRARDPRM